jgi:hypothetical protein
MQIRQINPTNKQPADREGSNLTNQLTNQPPRFPTHLHTHTKQHLEYIFSTLARALKPHKGLLAFTLEALKDGDPQLLREREAEQSQAQQQQQQQQQQQEGGWQQEEWILRDTGACVVVWGFYVAWAWRLRRRGGTGVVRFGPKMEGTRPVHPPTHPPIDSFLIRARVRQTLHFPVSIFLLGRYAHRREYVEAAAAKAGLETLVVDEMVGRKDKGKDIPGYLFLMKRK